MVSRGAIDSDFRVLLRMAIVVAVNPDTYTVSAQLVNSEVPVEEVILGGPYVSLRGPGWMGALPEVGDLALLAKPEMSEDYILINYVPYPNRKATDGTEDGTETAPRNDYRGDRPILQPGELGMMGPAGGEMLIRRNGNMEIKADPLCTQAFFRDEKTIKTVCQNFVLEGIFGSQRYWTLREDGRDEQDETPTGMSLQLKSLAQQAPHIFVDAGAVLEDESLPPAGYPSVSQKAFGFGSCVRIMIFEQAFAQNQASAGLNPPDPRQARVLVRMYASGDIQIRSKGHVFMEARDRTSAVYGREVVNANSIKHETTSGAYEVTSAGQLSLKSKRAMSLLASGKMRVQSKDYFHRASNGTFSFDGGCDWKTQGNFRTTIGGHATTSTDGGLARSIGESLSTAVGGRYSLRVMGGDALENAGRDIVSHRTIVKRGKSLLQVESGSLELNIGPAGQALGYMRMINDPVRLAAFVGRVELGTKVGGRLVLQQDGAWQVAGLGGRTGSVHSDVTGRIHIGSANPATPAGYAVTTLSHKCYVTGLPPLGTTALTVSSLGPPTTGAAGVAAPAVAPLPTPQLPEAIAAT